MIYNLPVSFQKDTSWELAVRHRMAHDGVAEHEYAHLVVKPYPTPEELILWLNAQFPDEGQYVIWKGWMLFKNESDAVLTAITWMSSR